MSLRRRVLANYLSQGYAALIGIVMIPVYIQYMGAEAYGLVALFTVLQTFFNLLDAGLMHTIVREAARFKSGVMPLGEIRRFLRTLECIFASIASIAGAFLIANVDLIATHWLKLNILSPDEAVLSLQLMVIAVSLRFVSSLYRGLLIGFERQSWLSVNSVIINSFRYVLVVPYLLITSATPESFFVYQGIIAILELVILAAYSYSQLPRAQSGIDRPLGIREMRERMKFAVSISFATTLWVAITQTDKVILSGQLLLEDYGYFALATLVASAVGMINRPLTAALLPRMTNLYASEDRKGLLDLYGKATQIVACLVLPVVVVLATLSESVLWSWTGDRNLSQTMSPILSLYVLGNGLMTLSGMPFLLQYAKGDLGWHLRGYLIFATVYLPLVLVATISFGMWGAATTWMFFNLGMFCVWIPFAHNKLFEGLHRSWLRQLAPIACGCIPVTLVLSLLETNWNNRAVSGFIVATSLASCFVVCAFLSPVVRGAFLKVAR